MPFNPSYKRICIAVSSAELVMPGKPYKPCHCLSHSCKGGLQEAHVLRQHLTEDRLMIATKVGEASAEALDEQHRAIAEYIAAQTSLDVVTGHSETSPFDLGQLSESLPSLPKSPPHPSGRIQRVLTRLGQLDDSVDAFKARVEVSLAKLSLPGPEQVPGRFPLQNLIQEGHSIRDELDIIDLKTPAVVELKTSISRQVQLALERMLEKEKLWQESAAAAKEQAIIASAACVQYNSEHHFQTALHVTNPALQVMFFAIVALHVIFTIPRRSCRFVLQMYRYSLQLALSLGQHLLSRQDQELLANIPEDPETLLKQFHLEGRSTIRAVCPDPKCHFQYDPIFDTHSPIPRYPSRCNHRRFGGGKQCKQPLLRPKTYHNTVIQVPIKSFVSFSLKDWISSLVSRPGIEAKLDQAWRPSGSDAQTGELRDIFDGSILQNFRGPDGNPFSIHGDEGHYAFSLCVDFFNPAGNKQSGRKKSVGIISLVCLNLPPGERYKPENMFLAGIIPGPNEPTIDCINHYLTPLITELLEFWKPGVFISQTHKYPMGRIVRCALVAVVCDIPAARKTAGFAAVAHEFFCSICECRKSRDGFVGKPYIHWDRRTNAECREHAEKYRNAADEKSRLCAFNEYGVRWSELLRLPYFDPSRFVVVDAMHNLFLGLIQEHCKHILGLELNASPVEKALLLSLDNTWEAFSPKDQTAVQYLRATLESPLDGDVDDRETMIKRFTRRSVTALSYICNSLCLDVQSANSKRGKAPTKVDMAVALADWRLKQEEQPRITAAPGLCAGHALVEDDMAEIRRDIEAMLSPSWTSSIPENLGCASHGKLKADQWRMLGTVYLPASLIRLWGSLDPSCPRTKSKRQLLQITMSLLSAIGIATAHSTSAHQADLYLSHLQSYIDGVKALFPDYKFRPNHHMAFHIHDYLLMYGPVHSWWCFPFERMIGMLQHIPNNGKGSEYEETIAKSFTRASNLRAMLYKSQCPQALENCRPFFDELLGRQVHNATASTDLLGSVDRSSYPSDRDGEDGSASWSTKASKLPLNVLSPLQAHLGTSEAPVIGVSSSHISIRGLSYSIASRHAGNSQCIVSSSKGPVPAIIQHIFQVNHEDRIETFLLIEQLSPASVQRNPFTRYIWPEMGLYVPKGKLMVIEPSAVLSHFAQLPVEWEGQILSLAISLSRN